MCWRKKERRQNNTFRYSLQFLKIHSSTLYIESLGKFKKENYQLITSPAYFLILVPFDFKLTPITT
jgi:hypothetical protein